MHTDCPYANAAALVGRILLSVIFLMSGVNKIFDFAGTQAYMAQAGMPYTALFLVGAIVFEVVGGLSLVLGYKTKWGAVLLIVFLIPATLIFHRFWSVPPEMAQMQMINFLKNIAILGGLLQVAAFGPGRFSLDARGKATTASNSSTPSCCRS
jgi:uncharacterized membrane protein YphA (DoxX/SURF4 family)